ncbi:hypothetical protein BDA96_04G017800 [Sorghum bicolor]|uniref:Uncharacterized protein n=2 Tax=Sorghum bicolor TaxID=4558 RepID=A0A921UIS9_SORBI|nr:hypothetical protein BDA96_04G017800 [Sorghum bicolor]KXG29311.1 hypothetical protein SORBI_3004G015600 [Sorghum bicolor]
MEAYHPPPTPLPALLPVAPPRRPPPLRLQPHPCRPRPRAREQSLPPPAGVAPCRGRGRGRPCSRCWRAGSSRVPPASRGKGRQRPEIR